LAWGTLIADLESQGGALPAIDSLIAATALHHELHLVTRNEKDFEGTGVIIINPWTR
jgi:tRNA(fMet)-specific endonuclease VapC